MTNWIQSADNTIDIDRVSFFETALTDLLNSEGITLTCGQWDKGGIMELIPNGKARLLSSKYTGKFAGVRELRIDGVDHHAHVDLGRIHSVEFRITPSVCLGFRPSFEACFMSQQSCGSRTGVSAFSIMLSNPYKGSTLCIDSVKKWYQQYKVLVSKQPDAIRLVIDPQFFIFDESKKLLDLMNDITDSKFENLRSAVKTITKNETSSTHKTELPVCKNIIEDAISLNGASLVIFRDRTLVEFKTEELEGLYEYREGPYVSWQIGHQESHHCHLDLSAVTSVEFSAEPVSCQGGRLNYTVWFLVPGGCGNTFRSDGYFSFTLNRPYKNNLPRLEIINPVFELYKKYQSNSWVTADQGFLSAMASFASSTNSLYQGANG
ncbi:MAG: hypothetical protein HRT45_13520 [Bdellovibrionales bacterium]|nr:hypothetical protein [Bdellovibrionales bacterium]